MRQVRAVIFFKVSASHLNVAVLFRIDMTQEEERGQGNSWTVVYIL